MLFSEFATQLNEETVEDMLANPSKLFHMPSRESAKLVKNKNFKLNFGKWEKDTDNGHQVTGRFASGDFNLSFYSTTVYSVTNRLRDPAKTKYQVYVTLRKDGISHGITADFGSARGESSTSADKVKAARQKAIKWAKQNFDIELTEYAFIF